MTVNTDFLSITSVLLYRIQKGNVMKKDKKSNQKLLQYLEEMRIKEKDIFIIPSRKKDDEYKQKLLNLLKIIGPIAKA